MGQSSGMNRFTSQKYHYHNLDLIFFLMDMMDFFPQLDGGKFSTIPHHHLSALIILSDSNISYVVFLSLNMIFYQSYALVNSLLE